jgi:predicted lipase
MRANVNLSQVQKTTFRIEKNIKKRHLHCAKLCQRVYEKKADVLKSFMDDRLYIAVEGTDTGVNWYDNISVTFRSNDIHRGFLRYATHCLDAYDLRNECAGRSKITICGHSLGAASATIMVYLLRKEGYISSGVDLELVTFGSPKPGGVTFSNNFAQSLTSESTVFSYQNYRDPVCSIPFSIQGYVPAIPDADTYILNAPDRPFWDVSNHYMQTYIDMLETLDEVDQTK